MESLDSAVKQSMERTQISITGEELNLVLYTKVASAGEVLEDDPDCKFSIMFTRSSPDKPLEEKKSTRKTQLKESFVYFEQETITFNDIDVRNDLIDATLVLLRSNNMVIRFKPTVRRLKDLIKNAPTEDIWTCSKCLISLKYLISRQGGECGLMLGDPVIKARTEVPIPRYFHKVDSSVKVLKKKSSLDCDKLEEKPTLGRMIEPVISDKPILQSPSIILSKPSTEIPDLQKEEVKLLLNSKPMEEKPGSQESPNLKKTNSVRSFNKSNTQSLNKSPLGSKPRKLQFNHMNSLTATKEKPKILKRLAESPETNRSNSKSNPHILDFEYCNVECFQRKNIDDFLIDAVFVSGLSSKGAKVMNNSERLISCCRHKSCSILCAFKPEVLVQFPSEGRAALEIISTAASLCFTSGVKLCYSSDQKKIPPMEDYINVITNEKGDRFFLYCYHIYIKYNQLEFSERFNFNPIKEFFQFKEILPLLESQKEERAKIEKKLQSDLCVCTEFNNNDYVYIPYCLAIVSKKGYIPEIKRCMKSLVNIIFGSPGKHDLGAKDWEALLLNYLTNIVYEIPRPRSSQRLKVYLPYSCSPIEIRNPNRDLPRFSYNLESLFQFFSAEAMLIVFHLILLESKCLFVSRSAETLTRMQECFKRLLYPLDWVNTYIPVLSEDLIKFLQSFIPFIMGIEEHLFSECSEFLCLHDDLFIINLDRGTVESSASKVKITKKTLSKFVSQPNNELFEDLFKSLKDIAKLLDQAKKEKKHIDSNKLNRMILTEFCRYSVLLYGDYQKYLSFIEGIPCFNLELYLSNKPSAYRPFYRDLIQTQIFNNFLQMKPDTHPFFDKLLTRHSTTVGHSTKSHSKTRSQLKFSLIDICSDIAGSTHTNTYEKSVINVKNVSIDSKGNSANEHSDCMAEEVVIPPFYLPDEYSELSKVEEYSGVYSKGKLINLDIQINSAKIFDEKENFYSAIELVKSYSCNTVKRYKFYQHSRSEDTAQLNFTKRISSDVEGLSDCNALTQKEAKENEKLRDKIVDILRKLLTSEDLTETEIRAVNSFHSKKYGRRVFAEIIYLDKFKCMKYHQLNDRSFQLMMQMVSNSLILAEFNSEQLGDIIKITKACFHYYKKHLDVKGKETTVYLYQELINNHFKIWDSEDMWISWYKEELNEESESSIVEFQMGSLEKDSDEYYYSKILPLFSTMKDLGLDLKFILGCVSRIADMYIDGQSYKNELSLFVVKQYNQKAR